MCKEHHSHELKAFDTQARESDLSDDFECISNFLFGHVPLLKHLLAKAERRSRSLRAQLASVQPRAASAEADFARDMELLDQVVEFLNGRAVEARSTALRRALDVAKRPLDVEAAVRGELQAVTARRDELTQAIARAQHKCTQARAQLERVARARRSADAPRLRYVLQRCDLPAILRTLERRFTAFDGAHRLDHAKAARTAPFSKRGRVRVSKKPVYISALPLSDRATAMAALGGGALVWVSKRRFGLGNELHVFDLRAAHYARLPAPNALWARVYGAELFVGVRDSAAVRVAPLAAALAGLQLAQFDAFATLFPPRSAAERTCTSEVVLLGRPATRVARLDVATRTALVVECDRRLCELSPILGVAPPGLLCAARAREGGAVLAVFENGRTRELACVASENPRLLPSAAAPGDVARVAMLSGQGRIVHRGRARSLPGSLVLHTPSLVRLYRSVFLCLDARTWRWCALRIAVS